MSHAYTRVNPILIVLTFGIAALALVPALAGDMRNVSGFAPHGFCIAWSGEILWMHVVSDLIIGIAYMVIAGVLGVLVFRVQRDLPFHWLFLAFGAFIFSCGLTHFIEIIVLWNPWYRLSGGVKVITALASILTAVATPLMLPRIEQTIADAKASNNHRRQRDRLLDQQLAAVSSLQATLASREGDLLRLTDEIAAQRRERDHLLEQLRQSEARYRQIVETAREGIWVVDAHGLTTYVNEPMLKMLGYSVDELLGQSISIAFSDGDLFSKRLLNNARSGTGEQLDLRLRTQAGAELWTIISFNPLYNEHGDFAGVLLMITDITERRQLETQIAQSQKLESVGRLAGGVAHDFNNLLVVINGSAELAGELIPETHAAQIDLHTIRQAGNRAATLIRQLLTFARRQINDLQTLNLNIVITDMQNILRRLTPAHIHLKLELAEDLWPVRADPGQIEQVIVNLIVNARDAMPAGGQITIETINLPPELNSHQPVALASSSYVLLRVRDTGEGMSPEVQRHIFEPFYTTKRNNGGTGLGLATCYGIVTQHNGVISIESALEQGTTVSIYLPRTYAEPTTLPNAYVGLGLPRGTETVLLVEDEPEVRVLAARVLRAQGYSVLEAEDGRVALQVMRNHTGAPISLLLTDIIMPHMGGPALAAVMLLEHEQVKVLFMSGYADTDMVHNGLVDPKIALLLKPFTPAILVHKVRQMLDSRA